MIAIENPEIGRELTPSELVLGTVVIVGREDRGVSATMWISSIGALHVAFWAGLAHTTLLAKRDGETLCDDTGARITVNEFLGVV
jgi:hypothetical protein